MSSYLMENATSGDESHYLTLALTEGIGPKIQRHLLEHFQTPKAILHASIEQLCEVPHVGKKLAHQIHTSAKTGAPAKLLELCRNHDISIHSNHQATYPNRLNQIYDPPNLLFCKGKLLPQDDLAIAIVGTRNASSYGLRQAERFGHDLAAHGVTILSGLARGIDARAHHGALASGGRTIAVLGSGLLEIYPSEHKELAKTISENGALLSEQLPNAKPYKGAFPRRNRIIAGMSLGVLVIEAGNRSGALITAFQALEQNREVFALPGSVESKTSQGCHKLLKEGAILVESADDVLEELEILKSSQPLSPNPLSEGIISPEPTEISQQNSATISLSPLEDKVLSAIGIHPIEIDTLIERTDLPAHTVL
ncbi:MAG: DNA-processing protein DprA, partial [Pirellulaceae bacterium]|nr:DNA-processing protein DprA [Pirellulaceae bacterium]